MKEEYMIPCMSKTILGIECAGCGSQRAFWLLVEGDFYGAFKMYPPIYTLLLLMLILAFHFIDKSRNYKKALLFTAIANGIIILINYIYNLIY
jgi:hypothetical protein